MVGRTNAVIHVGGEKVPEYFPLTVNNDSYNDAEIYYIDHMSRGIYATINSKDSLNITIQTDSAFVICSGDTVINDIYNFVDNEEVQYEGNRFDVYGWNFIAISPHVVYNPNETVQQINFN